ncbi:hypothetical protein C9I92_21865 [Photobacterium ganghwense]|uniref:Tail protein n=1 Tax=Photobacterium ganghwense TaxID=320778 RepID=A0A0J1K776_9GAMM|nr:hypothetical protein [Photobacterium ganghwense]KLV10187.1 hypothetical protein ABT57_06315 [Photobacterium ganghwense]PSU05436.1 hypothetical protein C9I92_21865 [Photobacterium ganghwense]
MRHLNVASVIDKSKLASKEAFVPLFTVRMDVNGELTSIYIARWIEDIEYKGNTYLAANFDFEFQQSEGEMTTASITGHDSTGQIQRLIESSRGAAGSEVQIDIVNTMTLDREPEFTEVLSISDTSVKGGDISFKLEMPDYLRVRYPRRIAYREYCSWFFKDERCGYKGSAQTCDYSLNGRNGCIAKGNSANFGGFPSIFS